MPSPASLQQEPLQDDSSSYGSVVDGLDDSSDEEDVFPFEMVSVKMEEEDPLIGVGLVTNKEVDGNVHSDKLAKMATSVSSRPKLRKRTEDSAATSEVTATPPQVGLPPQTIRHSCPHCSEMELTEEEMQLHLQHHCEQDGQFYCWKCKFSTTDRTQFYNHARRHPNQQLECPHCPYISWRLSEYRIHMRDHNKEQQPVDCDECGATLKSQRNLAEHCRRLHSDLVTLWCSLCSFSTLMPDSLAKHKQEHDMGKPILKCEGCDYTTINSASMQRHKPVHREKEPLKILKCEECSFETKYYHSMLHHKNVHTEVRHTCKHCSFTTVYPNNLRQHMRLHGGEKLSCSLCSYQTARKDSLKIHMRRHSEGQQFKCEQCSFASTYVASLRRHMIKVHHHVKPKIVTSLPGEKPARKKGRRGKRASCFLEGKADTFSTSVEEKDNDNQCQSKLTSSDKEGEAKVLSVLPDEVQPSNKRIRRHVASSDEEDKTKIMISSPGENKASSKNQQR